MTTYFKKKCGIGLCVAFMSIPGFAANQPPFQGFHLDFGFGGINATSFLTQNVTNSITEPASITVTRTAPDAVKNSYLGLLGIGYSMNLYKRLFLGVKLTGDIESTKITKVLSTVGRLDHSTSIAKITVNLKNSFALLFRAGMIIDSKTMIYGVIGPRWGNFSTNFSSSFTLPQQSASANINQSNSFYTTGFDVGIGAARYIAKSFLASVEYNTTNYAQIKRVNLTSPLNSSVLGNLGTHAYSGSINPRTSSLTLNFSYYFA